MPEPSFDRDGYPTDQTLQVITEWDYHDLPGLMAYIAKAWKYPNWAREVRPGRWVFSTGGWSGNEKLMSALRSNEYFSGLAWCHLYVAGGLWIFAISPEARQELDQMEEQITKWAWRKS